MRLHEDITLHGELEVAVLRAGEIIDHWRDGNLIVDGARKMLAELIAGDGAGQSVAEIGFGVGSDPVSPDDTGLTSAYWRGLSGHDYPTDRQVRFHFTLASTEANGTTIREFGLRTASGALFSRKTRGAIEKSDDISLEGTWTITL